MVRSVAPSPGQQAGWTLCLSINPCPPDTSFHPTPCHVCRHLGSFYNDSELYGGITSSPITHGFDHMNATVEVAPTSTLNYQCNVEWNKNVDYGHYGKPTHCNG